MSVLIPQSKQDNQKGLETLPSLCVADIALFLHRHLGFVIYKKKNELSKEVVAMA